MSEAMNLLTRADHLARDILLDSHDALLAPGLLRGWAAVIGAAAAAESVIPAPARRPDTVGTALQHAAAAAQSISRDAESWWAGNRTDDRSRQITQLLTRLTRRVQTDRAAGRWPGSGERAQLRAGLLHTSYLLTHAAGTATGRYASALSPEFPDDIGAVELSHQRLRGVELTLDVHLHHRPWTSPAGPGGPCGALEEALGRWDQTVHTLIGASPDPKHLYIVADTTIGLLAHTARIADAAPGSRLNSTDVRTRLLPALANATRAWEDTRRLWASLATPTTGISRDLATATGQLHHALRDPGILRNPHTPAALAVALAVAVEAAALTRTLLIDPRMTAPADTLVRLTGELARRHPAQSHLSLWMALDRFEGRAAIRVPGPLRQDLDQPGGQDPRRSPSGPLGRPRPARERPDHEFSWRGHDARTPATAPRPASDPARCPTRIAARSLITREPETRTGPCWRVSLPRCEREGGPAGLV